MMKKLNLKDRLIVILGKGAARAFVFSTRFGKQTYAKRAIRTVYKVARKK
jgi:hypothetical protein